MPPPVEETPRERSTGTERLLLGAILAVFFLLALRTIRECEYYPSEQNVIGPALGWLGHPEKFKLKYPPFAAFFYTPFLALHYRMGSLAGTLPAYLTARLATLALSTVSLFLLWRFARRVGGGTFALLATFFLAANHCFFALSQLVHPEALLVFLVVVQLNLSLGILKTGRAGFYLASGVAAAAAIATKYFALAFFPPIAAHVLRARATRCPPVRTLVSGRLAGLLLAGAIGLLLFIPHLRQFFRDSYPIIRNDGYFSNVGPCCWRLTQAGLHRSFLWPLLAYLPYGVGLWGYLAALAGMVVRQAEGGARGEARRRIWLLLLGYVLVVFMALQAMTSYLLPQAFTTLFPAIALFSGRFAERVIGWATERLGGEGRPRRRRQLASVVASLLVLGPALPGLYSVLAFYMAVSTNGNRVGTLITLATRTFTEGQPADDERPEVIWGGFDMVTPSQVFEEAFAAEPTVVFVMDCFVENARKRASTDPYCKRLAPRLESVRAEADYVEVARFVEPDWWGRRLYERLDPEFSLDMRLYVHRSVYDVKKAEAMLDEFEETPGSRAAALLYSLPKPPPRALTSPRAPEAP